MCIATAKYYYNAFCTLYVYIGGGTTQAVRFWLELESLDHFYRDVDIQDKPNSIFM